MTTYGKKHSRLPSFLTFGDLQSTVDKGSMNKAVPIAQLKVHPDSGEGVEGDDSIAKMASALLDDTVDQERDSSQHSAEHLRQVRHSKTTPNLKGGFYSQVFESANNSYNPQSIFEARKATNRGANRSLFRDSYESTKQLGRKGKGALTKMKNSVVDILQGGSPRSEWNSMNDKRLLESSSNKSQGLKEGQATGKNSEEGNSPKKLPSYKGPEPLWNPLRMHPPGSTMQPPISRNQLGDRMEVEEGADSGVASTHHKHPTKSGRARIRGKVYCPSEFNAFLSSSPDGHSTPRVRAEPSFDDATRSPRKISSDTHSLLNLRATTAYNPNVEIDEKLVGVEISIDDGLKRKRIPEVLCSPKRTRKHPSPSPEALKLWGDAMDELKKTNFTSHEDVSLAASVAGCPSSKRHANKYLRPAQGPTHPSNAFATRELPKGASFPISQTEGLKSTMRRQVNENREHRQSVADLNRNIMVISVEEDEDELQSDNPNYIIMRKYKP